MATLGCIKSLISHLGEVPGGRRGWIEVHSKSCQPEGLTLKPCIVPVNCERSRRSQRENYGRIYGGNKLNGVSFRQQHAIGNYVPDLVAIKRKIIIELDGSQHLERALYDIERTACLESQGYKVIRFWNHQVMNDIEIVIRAIQNAVNDE